jgi:hypothetical protein
MRWVGNVEGMKDIRNAYKILVGNPERKTPLGRPRRRWEHDIKMNFKEKNCGMVSIGFMWLWVEIGDELNMVINF